MLVTNRQGGNLQFQPQKFTQFPTKKSMFGVYYGVFASAEVLDSCHNEGLQTTRSKEWK